MGGEANKNHVPLPLPPEITTREWGGIPEVLQTLDLEANVSLRCECKVLTRPCAYDNPMGSLLVSGGPQLCGLDLVVSRRTSPVI